MGDIPAFTDDEIAVIRLIRNHEIRVDHDGRLHVHFQLSDEYMAAKLHAMLRPGSPE